MKPSVSELVSTRSVSDDKTIEATSSCVFVTDHTVVVVGYSLSFDLKKLTQVLEQLHLIAKVLCVILDVPLMGTEVLHNILLLSQLCLEEFLIRFELLGKTFVRVAQMLCFITNTSSE
jgi:hypothetical protein